LRLRQGGVPPQRGLAGARGADRPGGLAAEARHTGVYDREAAARDLRHARRLALERAGSERQAERLEKRLLAKAENLLDRPANWAAVERIAVELLRLGEMSGRQARHLYEECLRRQE